ncbi:Myosin-1 [Orchesella cincta]|uniref:Myosin-1 n=1 Tax=Orchesella cincta TaxID=48709 RepID=A0A1D2MLA2_ORCCI|nr:Myosin-1 [Orchesella cincta]
MENNSSMSSSSSVWDTSLSEIKRKTGGIRESLAEKQKRISELEAQLAVSQHQIQEQAQFIRKQEHLEKELRNQVRERDEEINKLKNKKFWLKIEEEKCEREVENWKEVATRGKAELKAALKAKEGAEERMKKMEEEIVELTQSLMENDEKAIAPAQASSDDDEEEEVNETGRGTDVAVDDSEDGEDEVTTAGRGMNVAIKSSMSSSRNDWWSQPPSSSSSSLVLNKSSVRHAPSKSNSVGSSLSGKGLAQPGRWQMDAGVRKIPPKPKGDVENQYSVRSRGSPKPEQARRIISSSSSDGSESEEEKSQAVTGDVPPVLFPTKRKTKRNSFV